MIIPKKYFLPTTVNEALALAQEHAGSFKYVSGGTDLFVNKFQENELSSCFIDLNRIPTMKGVELSPTELKIGALETLATLAENKSILELFPILAEAALSVGSPLIRNTATLGGNVLCENRCIFYNQSEWWRKSIGYCLKCDGDICIATGGKNACFSEFVSDTAPALIAYHAEIEYIDDTGLYRKNLECIYTGDGVESKNLPKTAIVMAFYLPVALVVNAVFHKLRQRESLEYTSLTTAVSIDAEDNIRLVLAGVDPKPVVIETTSNDSKESVLRKAFKLARAIDNDMYSRKYRKNMIEVYLNRSFEQLNVWTKI